MKLGSRTALVTGGGRGVGLATAQKLAADGASVVVNDLDPEVAEAAVRSIREAGGTATACAGTFCAVASR